MENLHLRDVTIYSWPSNPLLTLLPSLEYTGSCFLSPPLFTSSVFHMETNCISGRKLLKHNSSLVDIPLPPSHLHLSLSFSQTLSWPLSFTHLPVFPFVSCRTPCPPGWLTDLWPRLPCILLAAAPTPPCNATVTTLPSQSILILGNFLLPLWGGSLMHFVVWIAPTSHPSLPLPLNQATASLSPRQVCLSLRLFTPSHFCQVRGRHLQIFCKDAVFIWC